MDSVAPAIESEAAPSANTAFDSRPPASTQPLAPVKLRNVYVSWLPLELTEAGFRSLLQPFGKVTSCRFFNNTEAAVSAGKAFGFALYETPKEAAAAVEGLDGAMVGGSRVQVHLSRNGIVKKSRRQRGPQQNSVATSMPDTKPSPEGVPTPSTTQAPPYQTLQFVPAGNQPQTMMLHDPPPMAIVPAIQPPAVPVPPMAPPHSYAPVQQGPYCYAYYTVGPQQPMPSLSSALPPVTSNMVPVQGYNNLHPTTLTYPLASPAASAAVWNPPPPPPPSAAGISGPPLPSSTGAPQVQVVQVRTNVPSTFSTSGAIQRGTL